MKKASFFVLPLALATAFTAASAFTLNGTVTDEAGTPVQGALVKLIAKGDSAQTDKDGKFVFKEDDALGLAQFRAGHIGIVDGVLRFSQSSNSPVLVSIFDMMGNLVLRQELHGSGQVDLRQGVTAQGSYFAKVRVGSAVEMVRFTATGSRVAERGRRGFPERDGIRIRHAEGGVAQPRHDGNYQTQEGGRRADLRIRLRHRQQAHPE